jgi:hypothetical protein
MCGHGLRVVLHGDADELVDQHRSDAGGVVAISARAGV